MRAIAVVATAVAAAVTNAAMPNGWKYVKLTWLLFQNALWSDINKIHENTQKIHTLISNIRALVSWIFLKFPKIIQIFHCVS